MIVVLQFTNTFMRDTAFAIEEANFGEMMSRAHISVS